MMKAVLFIFQLFQRYLSPGFRLAWTIASPELTRKMEICKQALDLCTNTFTQYIA